ncbi:MAG: hypothetical protein UIQ97_00660 [Eggerthellaceae bacterium]
MGDEAVFRLANFFYGSLLSSHENYHYQLHFLRLAASFVQERLSARKMQAPYSTIFFAICP